MSASPSDPPALDALSPVDGRYRTVTAPLRALLSEAALIRERIRIEAHWLLHLSAALPQLPGAQLTPAVRERARQLAYAPESSSATAVKTLEASINHDVKAVEYFIKQDHAALWREYEKRVQTIADAVAGLPTRSTPRSSWTSRRP